MSEVPNATNRVVTYRPKSNTMVRADQIDRRLAAILAADVEGYSRLMGIDEEDTLKTLNRCRAIIDPLIKRHHGHFVGSAGDTFSPSSLVRLMRSIVPTKSSRTYGH